MLAVVLGISATASADALHIVVDEEALSDPTSPPGYLLPDGQWFNHEQVVRACANSAGSGRSVYSLESGQCRELEQLAEPQRGLLATAEGDVQVVDLNTGQYCEPGSCEVMMASSPTIEDLPPEVFQDRFEQVVP
ncbi:hypothetical protein IC757_10850 [Wenzhouxiangella sp. AB-CW3]|uniref:hypothetical protein n=1 Tax=Wenzhouxiangella sp. AB-CW3 TaxID=2771012 RepID=UPI00168B69AC|nr:hypothetical protein [Wenzhouxiangella sp. AB-CW3]QOC21540.1 hypothetical protein IC757_10850 [Wenzhouxiangella sp. AB-CW3]